MEMKPASEKFEHDSGSDEHSPAGMEARSVDTKKTLRQMDYRVIPIVTLLYLLSFLDRGNIGNAKVQGMEEDLKLTGNRYNLAYTVFFFPYALLELPANLLLKKLRPSIWLPAIMVAWGLVTTLTGIVKSYNGLLVIRVMLGVAEAGQYPGCAYYLTMWYAPQDLGLRQGMFFSAAALAGSFSGLLAYALAQMDGVGGLAGWRWIFIIEGIVTVVIGVAAFFLITDSPDKAKWLTADQRAWATHRVQTRGEEWNGQKAEEIDSDGFKWKYVGRAFTDWQIWLGILVDWASTCTIYGMSAFLPSIVANLGYDGNQANLLTIPVYATACILTIVLSYLSDRFQKRSIFVIFLLCAELVGYVLTMIGSSQLINGLSYAGVFISTAACYPAFVLTITWVLSNLAPTYKRASGTAVLVGLGNLAGAMAPNFYSSETAPEYLMGHGLEIMMVSLGLISATVMRFLYKKQNKKREELVANGISYTADELADMGDRAPTYQYKL
ncbi:hypothetical protein LTR37_003945 [Vermiconidia calcicola]|uniref:Uncharacterized protein n=1 Tax=Vermiconidia calcicola TaxID=1690605 RepID=A0ACC3NNT4_9PEZI|nr:hypothetical protein LTR37_003945 [Vermiconidia calcicola]